MLIFSQVNKMYVFFILEAYVKHFHLLIQFCNTLFNDHRLMINKQQYWFFAETKVDGCHPPAKLVYMLHSYENVNMI